MPMVSSTLSSRGTPGISSHSGSRSMGIRGTMGPAAERRPVLVGLSSPGRTRKNRGRGGMLVAGEASLEAMVDV
jgi:hypothetical protein